MWVKSKNIILLLFVLFIACVQWIHCLASRSLIKEINHLESRSVANGADNIIKYAEEGDFSFQVSLRTIEWRHVSSGVLLSNRWVLSVASPFVIYGTPYQTQPSSNYLIVLSAVSIRDGDMYACDLIKIHESFNLATYDNNIALLRSTRQMLLHQFVQPIPYYRGIKIPDGNAVVVGWASVNFNNNYVANRYLSYTNVTVIKTDQCKVILSGLGKTINLLKSGCVSGNFVKNGLCSDTGMPVASPGRVLFGIFSEYIACNATTPLVFTAISNYATWIATNSKIIGVDLL